jgi:cystathionine beta-lyase
MSNAKNMKINTQCVHASDIIDDPYQGAVSPIHISTSYPYSNVEVKRYPRYFNTPGQEALCHKLAALEQTEAALVFGSGMGAVANALLAFLKAGDHIIFAKYLYGGTTNFIKNELTKFNILYDLADEDTVEAYEKLIKPNTKIIYIETPSNPLLTITDVQAVAELAKKHQLISMIDNTFASPINQNPHVLGIDVVIHSATKYLGGHSDILAGAIMASQNHIDQIFKTGINYGANLSDLTVWLLDRSIKTLALRVSQQNKNAKKIAKFLEKHPAIDKVYYPGLKSHSDYEVAKRQMKGFGGMMSFELKSTIDAATFVQKLKLIKPSMSLAGVESTILSPTQTSHALLTVEERAKQGIKDQLLRFSIGIEDVHDLIDDLTQALK